jgi:hypothetical protein
MAELELDLHGQGEVGVALFVDLRIEHLVLKVAG